MRKGLFLIFIFLSSGLLAFVPDEKVTIYLFPGQGADHRQFRDLRFPEQFDTVHMMYPVPQRGEDLSSYAMRFLPLIDQEESFVLLGVSLGGMICVELADTLDPLQTILISSAKWAGELPGRYTFQKKVPINRLIPATWTKAGALLLQGIVEPDRRYEPETFKDMLRGKDPDYLKRTVNMIVGWSRENYPEGILHIHGDADNTIPIRNVDHDYRIERGSHMMVLTRAGEVSDILEEVLLNNQSALALPF
jgi:pimeloyl-ACP methyl ester carboxylesterase